MAQPTKELSVLYAVAATINRSLDLEEILYLTLDKILKTLRVHAGTIRLLDEERRQLVLQASRGIAGDLFGDRRELPMGVGISGKVAISGEPLLIEDTASYPHGSDFVARKGLKSIMCVPIRSKEKVVGTLSVASRTRRAFGSSDLLLLSAVGDQLGTGIENAMRYRKEQELVEQLKEIDRFKSEFLSNVSHELRTPLTSIIGFADLLMEKQAADSDTTYADYLRHIRDSGEHLLQMINNLLDLSKTEAGMMELFLGEFDLRQLLARVEKTVLPLVQKKNLQLNVRLEEPLPPLVADEGKVKQILLNLLSNAIKFTPEGGRITVGAAVKRISDGPTGEEYIEISVSDTGIGIKPGHLKPIFESFRQVDSTYTRNYQGTGIGLALCRRFVQMHGGRIWAESEFGQWTRFTFALPKKAPAMSKAAYPLQP